MPRHDFIPPEPRRNRIVGRAPAPAGIIIVLLRVPLCLVPAPVCAAEPEPAVSYQRIKEVKVTSRASLARPGTTGWLSISFGNLKVPPPILVEQGVVERGYHVDGASSIDYNRFPGSRFLNFDRTRTPPVGIPQRRCPPPCLPYPYPPCHLPVCPDPWCPNCSSDPTIENTRSLPKYRLLDSDVQMVRSAVDAGFGF